jgi:molybdopterin adenylyltransferase
MFSVCIVTVSDRSYNGVRDDLSGPEIEKWCNTRGYTVLEKNIVPDERKTISETLIRLSDSQCDLILTTGGTGFAPRDWTPEALKDVVEREVPGIPEVMRMRSLEVTNRAMLSRAAAGIRGKTLIINLPGSPKSVRENLSFIEDALPHALELLNEEVTDCGVE